MSKSQHNSYIAVCQIVNISPSSVYSPTGIPSNTENTEYMKYRVIISNREIGDYKFNHNKYLFQMLTLRVISDKVEARVLKN